MFFAACEHGLEGIIAKDRESPYRSGRRGDWQKIKCIQSDGFAIVGYEHSFVARAGIGSLLLGASHGRKLVYVGSVGTGFNERTAHELREALDKLKVKKPPVEYSGRRKYIVWVKPTLVAEVEYRAGRMTASCGSRPIRYCAIRRRMPGCSRSNEAEVSPVFGTGPGRSRGRDPFPMSARHGALIDTLGAIDMIALPSPGSFPTFQNNERMTNATTNSVDMIDSQFGRRVKPPTLVG
ncbi:hypothetical protein ACVJBD_002097 [Rhizobium mongolense]